MQAVGLSNVGETLKQQFCPCLVRLGPFVAGPHQQVTGAGEQFDNGVSVGQPFGLVGLVFACRLASAGILDSLLAALEVCLLALLEGLPCLVLGWADTTSSILVPLTMAMSVPCPACPSLLATMVYSSPRDSDVSSMLTCGPTFSGNTSHCSAWASSSHVL